MAVWNAPPNQNLPPRQKPKRRWLQFSTRALLVAVTALGIALAAFGWLVGWDRLFVLGASVVGIAAVEIENQSGRQLHDFEVTMSTSDGGTVVERIESIANDGVAVLRRLDRDLIVKQVRYTRDDRVVDESLGTLITGGEVLRVRVRDGGVDTRFGD